MARYTPRRTDGLCPKCGKRPRSEGYGQAYCDECYAKYYSKRKMKRAGLPWCSVQMLEAMRILVLGEENDAPFQYLDEVHGRTINALVRNGWVHESIAFEGKDRPRYAITAAGQKAFEVYIDKRDYRIPLVRNPETCPRCGDRHKGYTRSGKKRSYCLACDAELKRILYRMKKDGAS